MLKGSILIWLKTTAIAFFDLFPGCSVRAILYSWSRSPFPPVEKKLTGQFMDFHESFISVVFVVVLETSRIGTPLQSHDKTLWSHGFMYLVGKLLTLNYYYRNQKLHHQALKNKTEKKSSKPHCARKIRYTVRCTVYTERFRFFPDIVHHTSTLAFRFLLKHVLG